MLGLRRATPSTTTQPLNRGLRPITVMEKLKMSKSIVAVLKAKLASLRYVQELRDFRTFVVKLDYMLDTDNKKLLAEIDKKVAILRLPKNKSLRKFLAAHGLTKAELARHVKFVMEDELFEKLMAGEELDAQAKTLLKSWRKGYKLDASLMGFII